ncbi:MAG TPA: lipopolysaccharide kinase InaA family protein [Tepidisphaeraceae bacterium]|nr:lipopolysaccharide kinase InaA family protein [Tepidisphaeraceae bacterium]
MSQEQFEISLRNLHETGTLVKDRTFRQVWRFEHGGRPYFLKFYPRAASRLKRLVRGNPAMREFLRLQWLQKAGIPSARAVAMLSGFRVAGKLGDAVIMEAIEPGVPLDRYLNDAQLQGRRVSDHRELSRQVRELVANLGRAKLGHDDLHLGNFLLKDGKLHLLDAYAVRAGGLRMSDVMLLGHSVNRYASVSDLQRGWRALGNVDAPLPRRNPISFKQWRKFIIKTRGENEYFGDLRDGDWAGTFFKHAKYPRRWSPVSRLDTTEPQWRDAWRDLWSRIEADQLTIRKRSASGDVLEGEIVLGGRPVNVIVKRPQAKYWHRYLTQIGRGPRPRRAWRKAWRIIARDIPTAWPLLLMERRKLGYVTDALIVYERVSGTLLTKLDLHALEPTSRDTLFRRLGRTLRRLEEGGLAQFDAKSSNWMIMDDPRLGPVPVVIDVDGVGRSWATFRAAPAIERLLRSMRGHPQYTPGDSLALCQGYAPYAPQPRESKVASSP